MLRLKGYIKRICNSKDARTVVTNFGYLSILQLLSYAFPFITMPYLARVLGVDGFGKIAFAGAIMIWFITIADWGFNFTATRDIANNKDNKQRVSEIFSSVLWARCLMMLLSLIILVILVVMIPKLRENALLLFITFLTVPGHILFPDWFFQALERMKYITLFNFLSKVLFTLAVFVFIREPSDYILQPLFTSLGFIVAGLISMYMIVCRWKIRIVALSFSDIIKTIKDSFDVFLNNLLPNLYNAFSTVLLGFFGGDASNGILDAGTKFVTIAQQLLLTLSRAFFPFLSRRGDKHYIFERINILLSSLISLFLFITAPLLIRIFFTPEFKDAVTVLRILSVSIFFLSLNNVYGTNYMILRGYEKQLRNITIISSLIGFTLSFPLVYFFTFKGAAITIVITRSIMGIATMLFVKRLTRRSCY